jgi:hypothetical protein
LLFVAFLGLAAIGGVALAGSFVIFGLLFAVWTGAAVVKMRYRQLDRARAR